LLLLLLLLLWTFHSFVFVTCVQLNDQRVDTRGNTTATGPWMISSGTPTPATRPSLSTRTTPIRQSALVEIALGWTSRRTGKVGRRYQAGTLVLYLML
jgi:hypothetical protein